MKKYFWILAATFLGLSSCTKSQMVTDIPSDINAGSGSGIGSMAQGKRGVCFSTGTANWAQRVVDLQAQWYYNWGSSDVTSSVVGAEFVPMIWGTNGMTDDALKATCQAINAMYQAKKCFFVLGFNEPDLSDQSNMTVATALDKWQIMSETLDPGLKLVSPAPSYPTRQWLYDFVAGCDSRKLRLDYIAVHIYAGIGTSIYETAIKDCYANCGNRKVWVTEFAPRDDNASTSGTNQYTPDRVLDFMKVVVPKYESMPEVFRYSWFSPGTASYSPPNMLGLITSQLTNNDGTALTPLGEWYKTVDPNTAAQLPQ